jgi:hypothetical protein
VLVKCILVLINMHGENNIKYMSYLIFYCSLKFTVHRIVNRGSHGI